MPPSRQGAGLRLLAMRRVMSVTLFFADLLDLVVVMKVRVFVFLETLLARITGGLGSVAHIPLHLDGRVVFRSSHLLRGERHYMACRLRRSARPVPGERYAASGKREIQVFVGCRWGFST